MRLLHTADWHLGRTLGGHALLDDQAHVLEQVIAVARDTRPDLVIVAGDLYDRAVPPADAVRLLDDTLARIVLDLGIPVLAIAGNHDSPDRLAFGGRMLERSGLMFRTGARPGTPFVLADQHGAVEFHGLAYAEPAAVRSALQVDAHDHDAAVRAQIRALARDAARRAVLVAHAFVAGGEVSESERPLSVGTAGTVGLDAFTGFAYVALGHLHRPQTLAGGRVRYAGSPLKYSVSEVGHAKSLSLVEIDAAGAVKVEVIPLVPRRDVRVIRGMFDTILRNPISDDYILAELDDTTPIPDAHARLASRFPNIIGHTRPFYAAGRVDGAGAAAMKRDVADLFADFFTQTTGAPMSEAETAAFAAAHDAWQAAERGGLMRPLRLVMRGFGAYAGEQALDFTVLGDDALFLVHGPTGAGKTTILDAICFALFGVTSTGERDGRQMRSQHAAPDTPTEITLDFALGDQTWRVQRNPEYERPRLRGGGVTKEAAKADLWCIDAAGALVHEAGRIPTVDTAIERLLGFSEAQFRQVVVLPQGQFRKLLQANSKEREAILAVLFGTDRYASLQEFLKERARQIENEERAVSGQHAGLLKQVEATDDAELAAKLVALASQRDAAKALLVTRRAGTAAAQATLDKARQDAALLAERTGAEAHAVSLAAGDAALATDERRATAARRAASLSGQHDLLLDRQGTARRSAEAVDVATKALAQAEQAAATATERHSVELAKESERQRAAADLVRLEDLVRRLPAAVAAGAAVAEAIRVRDRTTGELAALSARATAFGHQVDADRLARGEATTAAAGMDGLEQRVGTLDRITRARSALDIERSEFTPHARQLDLAQVAETEAITHLATSRAKLEALENAWHAAETGRLAERLRPGEPCPVCGSHDHPAPATPSGSAPDEATVTLARDALAAAEESREAARETRVRLEREQGERQARIDQQVATLGAHATTPMADLQDEKAEAQSQLAAAAIRAGTLDALTARLATAETERKRIEGELVRLGNARTEAASRAAAAESEWGSLARDLPAPWLAASGDAARAALTDGDLARARQRIDSLAKALAATERAAGEAASARSAASAAQGAAVAAAAAAMRAAEEAAGALSAAVVAHGFADLAAWQAARLDPAALDRLEAAIRDAREARRSAADRLTRAVAAAEGLAAVDVDQLAAAAGEASRAEQAVVAEIGRLAEQERQLAVLQGEVLRLSAALERLRADYAVTGRLAQVATGDAGAYRVTFQTFVLQALLDEVADAASQRLLVMSGGRYLLRRPETDSIRVHRGRQTGLELVVDDAWTGYEREVATLSGGEGFMASLALALGLADVVQARAGGIRLDTIFIDEGFGSLDAEALDLALRVLTDLRASGRLVGVISHVAELRERIDVRLEVTRGERGSSARFVLP